MHKLQSRNKTCITKKYMKYNFVVKAFLTEYSYAVNTLIFTEFLWSLKLNECEK